MGRDWDWHMYRCRGVYRGGLVYRHVGHLFYRRHDIWDWLRWRDLLHPAGGPGIVRRELLLELLRRRGKGVVDSRGRGRLYGERRRTLQSSEAVVPLEAPSRRRVRLPVGVHGPRCVEHAVGRPGLESLHPHHVVGLALPFGGVELRVCGGHVGGGDGEVHGRIVGVDLLHDLLVDLVVLPPPVGVVRLCRWWVHHALGEMVVRP